VKSGGSDLHDAKERLRHSAIGWTSNTDVELFEEYEEELVEKAAAVVPRATRTADSSTAAHASLRQGAGDTNGP